MREKYIPFYIPNIDNNEIDEVVDTLRSGWLTTGPKTKLFEKRFSSYVNSKHAIGVNSCTAALHLSLAALGIGEGDEVITTPFTFISTANVILHRGATPVFADIDPKTYNIDPKKIEKAITPKTKAILIVDYGGQACEFDEIREIADKHSLEIVEDAAHAVGTEYKGRKVGSLADLTCFSFYATKNLTTGEGGMITTNDDDLANQLRVLSLHGMSKDAWKRYQESGSWYYEVVVPGYKCNFTDIQASLGLHQLEKLEKALVRRDEIAEQFNKGLGEIPGIVTPYVAPYGRHAWHLYAIQVQESVCGVSRDALIDRLKKEKIGTSVHFIPVHMHPYFRDQLGFRKKSFPITERVYSNIVSLPFYPQLEEKEIQDIIVAIRNLIVK